MNKLLESLDQFTGLSKDPAVFLSSQSTKSEAFLDVCSALYDSAKFYNKSSNNDPFTNLLTKGFDHEQIWQQIDMFNAENIKTCSKGVALCLNDWIQLCPTLSQNKDSDAEAFSEDLDEDEAYDEDQEKSINDSEQEQENKENKIFEKTEVDDDFFSLRQMEKFLDAEESENKTVKSDDDIDYFNDFPSTDEEENGFFEDNNSDAINGDSDDDFEFDKNDISPTSSDANDGESGDEDDISIDDNHDGIEENSNSAKQSARHVKYESFFPEKGNEPESKNEKNPSKEESLTRFQKEQLKMSRKIQALEEQALNEKSWQMKGEAAAAKRPVNSLIEEVVTFQHSQRPAPDITDEHTHDLESIICQRIKDKSWDDVEKKIKEIKDPAAFKKKVVLDSEQSKLSLQEIYEKEYLSKLSQETHEDKENPAHVELKSLMTDLFQNLDALANYHFRSTPPEPEIKVMTNLPSIAMEEVQPVTHTDADLLAPEEVHRKQEVKGDLEKTQTDKKRERRKKAARQKVKTLH